MKHLHSGLYQTLRFACYSAAVLLLAACGAPDSGDAVMETPAASEPAPAAPPAQPATVRYVADRIIVGDGEVLEPGQMIVSNDGVILEVGAAEGTGGDTVVNLNGMTIMPALIDSHVHLSTNRADLLDDLRQRAALGVSAAQSMGADGLDAPIDMRGEVIPGAARFTTAGRGITSPEPGRRTIPHWVTSAEEAREAVRAEAARNVDLIKIWVDDRDGQYEKLSEELYTAVIEEAHAHDLPVAAHIFDLVDAKALLRAGIDIFAHGVRDQDIDEELIELVRERPDVILIPNLPPRGVPMDLAWLDGILPAEQLATLAENNVDNPEAEAFWGIQARNLARLSDAGMTIAMGTDGNDFWQPHVEMENMVAAGMTPHQVLVASTSGAAKAMGLDDSGLLAADMRADFLVLGSNPLDDITNTRDIADVYLAGDRVER